VRDVPEPPLLDVLIGRDIRDADEFLRQPCFGDLDDPFSIPSLRSAVDRALLAIKNTSGSSCLGIMTATGFLPVTFCGPGSGASERRCGFVCHIGIPLRRRRTCREGDLMPTFLVVP
jgi:hypothetical protein